MLHFIRESALVIHIHLLSVPERLTKTTVKTSRYS